MQKKIKSKKFVVYLYQGGKGGGNIHHTDVKGKMTGVCTPFATVLDGMEHFKKILADHLQLV